VNQDSVIAFAPEDQLRVADDVLGVCVVRHLQLESADVVVAAQCPEVRLLNVQNAMELTYLYKKKLTLNN